MNINVLIIEDDFRIANIHQEMIEQVKDYNVVHSALTAKDALTFLQQADMLPQLILLDMYIPDVQQFDLLEKLRTTYPYIQIIIASAANDTATIQAAKNIGVYDFILKPMDKNRLQVSLTKLQEDIQLQEKEWTQANLDILFHMQKVGEKGTTPKENELPKGIDKLTLDKMMHFLPQLTDEYITAQLLVEKVGVSRSTARRYLEYLDAINIVEATLHYGQVGRPQRMYKLRGQYEQK